jgi:hypothetical protein
MTIIVFTLLIVLPQEGEAVRKGVRFLVESQDRDGSWSADIAETREPGMRIAITAVCLHALAVSDPSAALVEPAKKGLGFIRQNLNALDGPFEANPDFNFNAWGVSFGLVHLHGLAKRWPAAAGPKPDLMAMIDALIKKAEKTQLPCGGWTYLKRSREGGEVKDGSVSFLTASMIEGLLRWRGEGQKQPDKILPRAVADLERLIGMKEGVPYSHTGDYSASLSGDHALRTVQTRLALLDAGKGTAEALEESIGLYFKTREEFEKLRNTYAHTPPRMIAGYYYYFGLLHVSRALRRAGRDPGDRAALLRGNFLKEQLGDGSWKDVAAGGKSSGTAFALLSLGELGTLFWRPSLDDAITQAKAESKPVLLLLTDGKKEGAETEKAMREPALLEVLEKFACVRVEITRDEPVSKQTKVTHGCAILVLDPRAEHPLEKPVKKWTGRRSSKPLRIDLLKVLKDWK